MEDVELDVALRQRSRPMRRIFGAVLVGVLVLVLVTISGMIVTVNPRVPAALGEILHGAPTPTATIGPSGNIAYYENGAPWGKLTVDSRPIPIDRTPKPDFLTRGRHTLIYRADPFPALRCTISTPAAASDTCPLDATGASRFGQPGSGARAVDLGSTIERLPAAQRDALIALIRGQIEYTSPVTTVRPGEHYEGVGGGHTRLETATQPLNATLQVRLWDANAQTHSMSGFPTCVAVCVPSSNESMKPDATAFPNLLEVWAHVDTGYHYTTQDSSVVLDFAPLGQTQQAQEWGPDSIVAFLVGWNGTWQVTRLSQDSALNALLPCRAGEEDFSPGGTADITGVHTVTGTRLAPNPTDGCLLVVRQKGEPTSGAPHLGPPILFLHRFGVLLAVGDDAHQLLPDVTVASQRESDEAYAIAAQGPLP